VTCRNGRDIPPLSLGLHCDVPAVSPHDDCAELIGTHDSRPNSAERGEDIGAWMAVKIIRANGNYRSRRMHSGKEVVGAARRASMVPDLENVRVQFTARVFQQPLLFRRFCVTNEKHSDILIKYEGYRTCRIGI